ncbi:hypothetical protein DPMN_004447 [Dreissena polymorpha]|uniref:Uncharacterized protein n=2 Tax=Dreissena polymorpha TaxID=45954 RepID=A0A9D4RT03_DREPO|nr:hypothetical protein DPMN_004447 [Dreissena polymorpha]
MHSRKTHPETRQKETSPDGITRRDEERRETHTASESHGNRTDDEDCCRGCCWTTRGKRSRGKQDVIIYKQYEHGNHAYQYEQYPVRDYAGVSNKDFLVRKGFDSQENKRDESPRRKSSRDSSSVGTDDEDEQNKKTGCCAGLCMSTKGTRRRRRDDVIHNQRYEHGAFAFHNKNYEVKDYAGVSKRDEPSRKGKTDRVRSESPKQSRSKEAEDVNSKDDDDDEANPGCCACCCGTTKGRRKPVNKVEQTQHVYTQQPELYDNSFGIYKGNQPSKSELKDTKRKALASKPEISKDKTKEYPKEKDSKQKATAKKVETLQTRYATPVDANEKEYQEELDRMEKENVERAERENELRRKEKEERDRKRLEDEQKRIKEEENEQLKKEEDEQRRRAKEREIQHQQQLELARLQNERDQTNKEHEFHEREKQRMAQVEKAREREEEKRKEKENQEREKELQRKKNIEKERQEHEERLRRLEEKEKEREQYRQRQLQLAQERADERKREREDRERQRQQRLADLHENKDDKPDKVELDDDGYFDVGSPQRSPNTNDRRKEKPKRKVPPPRYLHNSNDKYLKGVNEDKIGHRGVHNPTLYVPPKKVKPVNFWRPFKNAVRFVNQSTL